ncbi:MAG: zinc-binding dehydrogenase, partial [Alphaproteobacteria bacterium]
MKAVVLHGYGDFDALRYEDVPTPEPGPGELLIRIRAVAVNHCDTDVRRGLFGVAQTMPHVMGVDAAGEVAAIGPGVAGFAIGDPVSPHFMLTCGACRNCLRGRENICLAAGVLGVTAWGTYAEYVKVPARDVVPLPRGLAPEIAVAAQVPLATSWEALIVEGGLRAGETVLINGAAGGVGSGAVQVAKLAGARVIATVGAAHKAERVRALGADHVVDYNREPIPAAVMRLTNGLGVDVAFDQVGGQSLLDSIAALAQGGRLVTVGAHGGEKVEIDMIEFFRKHISMHGCGRSTKAQVM